MKYLINFVNFWYDFVVGDDWIVAVGVIVALVVAAALARLELAMWWWLPLAVIVLLASSLWRVARSAKSS